MPQPAEQGFVTPKQQMISHPNLFLTPNTWESKCSKDLEWPDINARPKAQEMLQLWTEGSHHQFMPQPTFTSSSIIRSYFSTTAKPQWKLYSNPSSAELCSREGESNVYGRSIEHPNRGAWYISHQFHYVITFSCIPFFSVHENLGMRFMLRGVVLSHPKISNFGMWLKFTKF
jgi:hypothetical protein